MTRSFCGAFVAGLALVVGCASPISPTPSVRASDPIPWTPEVIIAIPPSGPSRTFVFAHELSYPVDALTSNSRWILYDNGATELQYPGFSMRGVHKVADGVFRFQPISPQEATIATWPVRGTLEGEVLTIDWDELAEESGYYDAAYILKP